MIRAVVKYERVSREEVVRECDTIEDLLVALAEAKSADDRPRLFEIYDDDTGRFFRVRAHLEGETTGLHVLKNAEQA